jgi:hypothetical protein
MKEMLIEFERIFNKNEDTVKATPQEILELEAKHGIKLSSQHVELITTIGNIHTPILANLVEGAESELPDIQQFWSIEEILFDKQNEWTANMPPEIIPFASDRMGNTLFYSVEHPQIWLINHDFEQSRIVCDSLDELLRNFLVLVRKLVRSNQA